MRLYIFDFLQVDTSRSLRSSLIVWSDPDNMGIAVGILLLSRMRAEIEVYPVLKASILDFSLPVRSYNILGSSIG